MDPMVFDSLEPQEVPVTIAGKQYVLREASEDVACKFRNAAMRAARMTEGKVVGVDGLADAEPVLVGGCLFEKVESEHKGETKVGWAAVGVAAVRTWPARIVKPLFERAKAMSDLAEGGETPAAGDAAKNGRGATADTSA
jgi:hypothetical protein